MTTTSTRSVTIRPELEISSEERFSHEDIELMRATICKGASDAEFRLFLNQCVRTGLDPLAQQIYSVPRDGGRVIQVAIDGYRLVAQRTGAYAGNDEPTFDTEEGEHPNIARVTVWRLVDGEPRSFTGIARWQEFKPPPRQDMMWLKMPWHMLAMAAERQALRKAFPQELAGLETSDDPPVEGPHAAYRQDGHVHEGLQEATPARVIRTAPPPQPIARPRAGGSSRSQLRETVANAARTAIKATIAPIGSPDARDRAVRYAASGEPIPAGPDEEDAVLRDELRELGTRGFDLDKFLTGRNKELDDLTRGELEGILPNARAVVAKRVERLTQQA
jgi:phage recombination protein Bet